MASAQAVAKNAFERLAAAVTTDHKITFHNTSVADVWDAVRKIEKEQIARRDNRFMRRVEPFIRTLESYSGVLDTFCQGYPPMSFVWGPIKLILVLAKNYTNVMDIILQAFNDIAETLPRVDRLKAIFPNDENLHRVIAWIYADLLEFHGRAYRMFTRRAWHYYFAFDWGLYEKRFKSVLQNLSNHCELLDKEAAVSHFAEMRSDRDQRKLEDEAFERRRLNQMSHDVFGWLSALEGAQDNRLHEISDTRRFGTCDWVPEDPQLKPWLGEDIGSEVLWMTGIPGSGKTCIASFLVEHLQKREDGCCGYFFCGQGVSMDVDCDNILRTLAAQIFQQNLDITPLIHETFIEKISIRSIGAIKKMLIQIIPHIKRTYLIIDGVDELKTSSQESILKIILDVVKNSNHNCKILVSSREEPQIKKFFATKQMKLGTKTADGLRQYIDHRMNKLSSLHTTMEPGLLKNIKSNLHMKAKGMFLWVRLVTLMLLQKGSISEIETAIDDLPDGLDEVYDRILNRFRQINHQQLRRRIFRIFHWLSVARRPVSKHELVDGIVLDFNQHLLNQKKRIHNVEAHVLDVCAPLLEETSQETLELVHFSAKEYLLDSRSGPFTKEFQAHFEVAKCCVINLNSMVDLIPNFTALADSELENRVVQGQYGLHSYASEFWMEHLLLYMAHDGNRDTDDIENEEKLFHELSRLTRILKRSHAAQANEKLALQSESLSIGLRKLEGKPSIWRLAASYLTIPQKIEEVKGKFLDVKDQEMQLLLLDETYMTHIRLRLHEIREKILLLNPAHLPAHISKPDYEYFISRYQFCCKTIGCNQSFKSVTERDDHQKTHVISFPCPDCDFSFRGFSSRRDLEKHLAKYHRSLDDIAIPASIQPADLGNMFGTPQYRQNLQGRWNEHGRQAKQNSFKQILKVLDATLKSAIPGDVNREQKLYGNQSDQLGLLNKKLEQRNYQTLEEFKADVRHVLRIQCPGKNEEHEAIIDGSCYSGLKQVTGTYPGFANAELAPFEDVSQISIETDPEIPPPVTATDAEGTKTLVSEGFSPQRNVYWSKMDKKEFPKLLKKFGKDFEKIADEFKTKTEADVARFYDQFVETGELDPSETVETAVNNDQPEMAQPEPATGQGIPEDHSSSSVFLPGIASLMPQDLQGPILNFQHVAELSEVSTNQRPTTSSKVVPNDSVAPKSAKKRRQRPRALCPLCPHLRRGLHDEYALRKHYERMHCPTRKVWTCSDISLDRFLADCDECASGKRYRTETNARKHLREHHFDHDTPLQTLKRWIAVSDEPNPRFNRGKNREVPLEEHKRRKLNGVSPQLPHVITHSQEQQLLPSIDDMLSSMRNPRRAREVLDDHYGTSNTGEASPKSRGSSIDESDEAESNDDADGDHDQQNDKRADFTLHPDISFDNILGTGNRKVRAPREDGPPHVLNRALIEPDQVLRLPHLTQQQRTIYLDQVRALHSRLERASPNSKEYKSQLEKLERLSQNLMSNLRDWLGHRVHAPQIPVKL